MRAETYVLVGTGGTGSYLINLLVHYLNVKKEESKVILVDGDVLEKRNLLRQGFIQKDVGKNKAEVLLERFKRVANKNVTIECHGDFVRSIDDIVDLVGNEQEVTLISCVDNNMARLRMLLAQYKIFFKENRNITFIDGGNAEWEGQTLVNKIEERDVEPIIFGDEIRINESSEHVPNIIFEEGWKDTLTVGDFEMSCDEIVESAPQNILANMTSAMGIMRRVNDKKQVRYQFDTRRGLQEEFKASTTGSKVLKEIVEYANGEGKLNLIEGYLGEVGIDVEEGEEVGEGNEVVDEAELEEYLESFFSEDGDR